MTRSAFAPLALTLLTLALPAAAHDVFYVGTLSGAKEAPANASPGVGAATITINDHDNTMRVQFSFAGLTGNVTAAHLHCCTVTAEAGTAGVATTTPTFAGMMAGINLGVSTGVFDRTFDMNLASSYNAAFLNNASTYNGNTALAFAGLVTGIADGKAYLNLHTTAVPAGEIRTFFAVTAVPEPESYALMLGGLGVIALVARRRRNRGA